jgi:ribosomal protein S18 acetylase RimI-like enzyme
MSRNNTEASDGEGNGSLRPLTVDDLDRVAAIDRTLIGRSRRGFFETRLKGALRDPKRFLFVGVCDGDELVGFVLARMLEGEFGGDSPIAVLDAIGLDPRRRGKGYGRQLMTGLEDVMRQKNVRELQSQLDWDNHALMRFLDAAGFRLAPRVVLSRSVSHGVDF